MARSKNASRKKSQDNDRSSGKEEEYSSATLERRGEEDDDDNEDVEYVVEISDPMKVKQAIDEAIIKAVEDSGIKEDHFSCNIKIATMTGACLCAFIAQFILDPFPAQYVELCAMVSLYFVLTGVLQFVLVCVDRDIIVRTMPCVDPVIPALVVKTSFDRLSETFTLWVCDSTNIPKVGVSIPFICPNVDSGDRHTKKELKVGNFFDYEGHFDEVGIEELTIATVRSHISKYKKKGT
eukprot:452820_1